MSIFRRRSLNDRMDSHWFLQPIQSIDTSDDGIGLLIRNEWQRYKWMDIRNPKLQAIEALWVASPFRMFMPRPFPRTPTPEEAIGLMRRRRTESGKKLAVFLRKSGIPTIELLSFQAGDRSFRINISSVGPHFENIDELRSILLDKLHPPMAHQRFTYEIGFWVGAIVIFFIGCVLVASAVSTF